MKLLKLTPLLLIVLLLNLNATAQEIETDPVGEYIDSARLTRQQLTQIKQLKFNGYIQFQYQKIDTAGASSFAGGNFPNDVDNRFTVRRARLRMTYVDSIAQYVFQIDGTERNVSIRDAYIRIADKKHKRYLLTAGIFNRPFGYEVSYSSRLRESPERGRMWQILFPNERDIGVMGSIDYKYSKMKEAVKLNMGLFNGTGFLINDIDSRKDLIGQLTYRNERNTNIHFGAGVSLYYGSLINLTKYVYTMSGNAYAVDSSENNLKGYENRIYNGANFQLDFFTPIGFSLIRAEYIQGQQPGRATNSLSPTLVPVPQETYNRQFNGGHIYFIHNILRTRHEIVFKYDWYDPNTKVKGKQIGTPATNTNIGDVRFDTYGAGYIFRATDNVRFMAYYDFVRNEHTSIAGENSTDDYRRDLKDNVLTVRLQYRF